MTQSMSRSKTAPYMPLYVADYFADTVHLSARQHGAYLLLLCATWRGGGKLPADDERLALLSKSTPEEWAAMRDVILAFFKRSRGMLIHERLSLEYAKYAGKVAQSSAAGKASARKKASQNKDKAATDVDDPLQRNSTNQNQNQNQSQNQNQNQNQNPIQIHKEGNGNNGAAPLGWPVDRKDWVRQLIAETACADPVRDIWPANTAGIVTGWHDSDGFEWCDVVAGIRATLSRPGPHSAPKSWRYFSPAIAQCCADRTSPTPTAVAVNRPARYKTQAQRNQDSTVAAFARIFGRPVQ